MENIAKAAEHQTPFLLNVGSTLFFIIVIALISLIGCDQVDLYFFTVGEKKESCGKSITLGKDTGDTVTVEDSASMCGTGEPEIK